MRLLKNSDEHRRNILQKILRFGLLEKSGVLLQFVRHLIDDEAAAGLERVICFLQECAFLLDLKNAKWNTGKNVIAVIDAGDVSVHVAARRRRHGSHVTRAVAGKLPFQIARESAIQFEQEQVSNPDTSAVQSRANAHLPRPVLGNHTWLAEIHLAGDAFHQRLGTGDDGGDLKRSFQKLFEKQGNHETRTVVLHIEVVQSRSGVANDRISTATGTSLSWANCHPVADISLDSSLVPDQLPLLIRVRG